MAEIRAGRTATRGQLHQAGLDCLKERHLLSHGLALVMRHGQREGARELRHGIEEQFVRVAIATHGMTLLPFGALVRWLSTCSRAAGRSASLSRGLPEKKPE